jgi:hypothetical protein
MASWYPLILLLHLSCAIVFVGAVCFEVLVLESLHHNFDHALMERIEQAVMARARRLMPGFVGLLFLSGFALFHIRCNGFSCLQPQFGWGWLLALKALLAFGVLAVFIGAVRAGRNGTMDPCRFRHTHRVVLILMIGIVVLAKLMFYA